MGIRPYLAIFWRRRWVIIVTVAITVFCTIVGTLVATPIYDASAIVRIATSSSSGGSVRYDDVLYTDRLMNTYAKIANSEPVLAELQTKLGLKEPPEIKVEILANTELMRFTASNKDPVLAATIADTLADILVEDLKKEYTGGGKTAKDILNDQLTQAQTDLTQARKQYADLVAKSPGNTSDIDAAKRSIELKQQLFTNLLQQYEQSRVAEAVRANAVTVVEPAVAPQDAAKPNKKLSLGLGLLVGLIGGIGLAFLFENLDTRLYSTQQIEETTELKTVGKIPTARDPLRGRRRQISIFNSNSPQEEAFRSLRTNLFTLDHGNPLKTLLITSAEPHEGKSTVAVNLARAIAQSGRSVLVVDCDMRLPSLHRIFGLANDRGLSTVLTHEESGKGLLQATRIPGVWVLTSGPLPPNPAELLGSSRMTALIQLLARQFDMVLFDAPSMQGIADPSVLAPLVDGVLLVVGRTQAHQESVRAAREQLGSTRARLVGVVVNKAEYESAGAYERYYHPTPT